MLQKIVLAGGTGYLGSVLTQYFKDKAKEIVVLTRMAIPAEGNVVYLQWNAATKGEWCSTLEDCDLLVNLCGKNVNCRYTKENQKEIIASRVVPTKLLEICIQSLRKPPKVWINLASSTIYRYAEDRPQDEVDGDIGTGFSVEVCQAWEKTFWNTHTPQTKKIALRTGIVFGGSDGVFPRLKNLVRTGLGGKQGTGSQYVSWLHELDFARMVEWLYEKGIDGQVYNATAPEAVQNKAMMAIIRNSMGVPLGLPAPHWLLAIGARIIGTETELILKSRWVYPKHLMDGGFKFQFVQFEHAVRDILGRRI